MLDTDTNYRIHTDATSSSAKSPIPNPRSEQITIALIYKFMDDIDAGAEELGGERSFFSGDYARYGWAKPMRWPKERWIFTTAPSSLEVGRWGEKMLRGFKNNKWLSPIGAL